VSVPPGIADRRARRRRARLTADMNPGAYRIPEFGANGVSKFERFDVMEVE